MPAAWEYKVNYPRFPPSHWEPANIPLREMILPYLCYANNGVSTTPYYLLSIKRPGRTYPLRGRTSTQRTGDPGRASSYHVLHAFRRYSRRNRKRLINNYGLNIPLAGKTGTTQNQADGWFIGYNPRIVVGVRVGANNSRVHFNSTALGQGANMALPIFGLFMQECLQSNTYAYWSGLSFRSHPWMYKRIWKYPTFKENINLLERLTNQKLEKSKETRYRKRYRFSQEKRFLPENRGSIQEER